MKLYLEQGDGENRITSYETGVVSVNGEPIRTSFVLTPTAVIPDWGPAVVSDIDNGRLSVITDLTPDVILLGSGNTMVFPQRELLQVLYKAGIGVEVMDTAAACRSYNILVDEGRNVAAALLMMTETAG